MMRPLPAVLTAAVRRYLSAVGLDIEARLFQVIGIFMYELPAPALLKRVLRASIPKPIWRRLKELQRDLAFKANGPYSFDEAAILRQVQTQPMIEHFFVDIGAQDGVLGSQTLALAKQGWAGVSYEADDELARGMAARYVALPRVKIMRELITPRAICDILARDGVPHTFGFLSLDIDSYDYYVLRGVLERFAPTVICVEINEMIPPPVVFAVEYRDSGAMWTGDRFQGFSIQAAKTLCNEFGYRIGELHYNNLLLVKSRANDAQVTDADIAVAYREGYLRRSDRRRLFPWNDAFEPLATLSPEQALAAISNLFADQREFCRLGLGDDALA